MQRQQQHSNPPGGERVGSGQKHVVCVAAHREEKVKTGRQCERRPALAKFRKVNQWNCCVVKEARILETILFGYWIAVTRIQGQSAVEWTSSKHTGRIICST